MAVIGLLKLKEPAQGSGSNGKVLNSDIEEVIADHYMSEETPEVQEHLKLRRACTPMKSFRYDKLKDEEQEHVFESTDWIAEEKINGWRMMLTYVPASGFMAWGGNLNTHCLPTDYTAHLTIADSPLWDHRGKFDMSFVMDCEATVEDLNNFLGGSPLENLERVLGSGRQIAKEYEVEGVSVHLHAFDLIMGEDSLIARKTLLRAVLRDLNSLNIHSVKFSFEGKKALLNAIWRNGGEGIILKNLYAPYVPGSRDRSMSIKVKRTMSGEIGDEIDAFVTGFSLTTEYTKLGLIGSIELSVIIKSEGKDPYEHVIANVSAMPDEWRKRLTVYPNMQYRQPALDPDVYGLVLRVDGQELTNRNRLLQHAVVDWDSGFHQKSTSDCTLDSALIEETAF